MPAGKAAVLMPPSSSLRQVRAFSSEEKDEYPESAVKLQLWRPVGMAEKASDCPADGHADKKVLTVSHWTIAGIKQAV